MKTFTVSELNIEVFDTRREMGEAAGKAVEGKILELLQQKQDIRIIFAAAPSQNELLTYLRNSSRIPWNRITAFHMDEYIGLSADAPQRFSNFLKERLFDQVDFKAVHLMDGNNDSAAECKRYTALLTEKPVDIVCLGIGENGHIAFNDPPVADFDDPEVMKVVTLDQACRQQQVNDGCFATIEQVPTQALTLTVPTLMQGTFLYCVVPGETKREAVAKTLSDPVSTACPATILTTHPNCCLYLDRASYPN
uniref:Glucosamine-6-phosphate deaminase n=1 Tax=Roseihalotalea indica TaxID=2867963 RepID=A0AA49GM31_9BACT|nr:glucosamine-6-phosphate deaminase [Tunicatimonas sp. TK19036]